MTAAVYKIPPDALQALSASIEPVCKGLAAAGRIVPFFGNVLQSVEMTTEGIKTFRDGERKAGLSKFIQGVAKFAGFDIDTLTTAIDEVRDAVKNRSVLQASAAVLAGAGEIGIGAVFGDMAGAMARDAVRLQTSQFFGESFAPGASSYTQMKDDVFNVRREVREAVETRRASKPPAVKM